MREIGPAQLGGPADREAVLDDRDRDDEADEAEPGNRGQEPEDAEEREHQRSGYDDDEPDPRRSRDASPFERDPGCER